MTLFLRTRMKIDVEDDNYYFMGSIFWLSFYFLLMGSRIGYGYSKTWSFL